MADPQRKTKCIFTFNFEPGPRHINLLIKHAATASSRLPIGLDMIVLSVAWTPDHVSSGKEILRQRV